MRPLRSGRGTFDVILDNVVACADLLPISIRVNLDTHNASAYERLLDTLVERGLSGRVTVYPGQIVAYDEGIGAPSETYRPRVLHDARVRRRRARVPRSRVPARVGAADAAAACLDAVHRRPGERARGRCQRRALQVLGLRRQPPGGGRAPSLLAMTRTTECCKWLRYDPFADEDCRSCVALPTCMGGCAHLQMTDPGDSKCSTFRMTHRRQVEEYAAAADAAAVPSGAGRALPIVAVS